MLESSRLLLRRVKIDDINDVYEYAKDEDVGPMAGWPPHQNIEDTTKIMNMWLDPNHKEEVFAIVYKDNNKVIGTTGVQHLNEVIKDTKNLYVKNEIESGKILYEIGIVVSKCYWNKGIATDVLKLIEEYIFVEKNADEIIACHYEANISSKRIQEKNNYKKVFEFERDKKWWKTDCTTMVVRKKSYNEWNDNNLKKE